MTELWGRRLNRLTGTMLRSAVFELLRSLAKWSAANAALATFVVSGGFSLACCLSWFSLWLLASILILYDSWYDLCTGAPHWITPQAFASAIGSSSNSTAVTRHWPHEFRLSVHGRCMVTDCHSCSEGSCCASAASGDCPTITRAADCATLGSSTSSFIFDFVEMKSSRHQIWVFFVYKKKSRR